MREFPETVALPVDTLVHAVAIACASLCWKGEPGNTEGVLGLADEFADYIFGESGHPPIPRGDAIVAGKLPKPR